METKKEENFLRKIDENLVLKHVKKLLEKLSFKSDQIKISPGTLFGDNYMGLIAKVEVITKGLGNEKKRKWIVKYAQTEGNFREIGKLAHLFRREIHMYTNVFPALEKLQEELNSKESFKFHPKCHYYNTDVFDEAIIMDDMTNFGFKLCDRKKTFDLDHCLLVIRNYAKYHSLSFVLKDKRPELFEELKHTIKDHYFNYLGTETTEDFIKQQTTQVLECLDSVKDQELLNKFNLFAKNCLEKFKNALVPDEYSVFTHGDCWCNNLLFKYGNQPNEYRPTNVCFIDYQLSSLASPILDISYFICSNTDEILRRQHFTYLLQEYYSCLSKSIESFGSDPEKLYPYHIFENQLKKGMVYGLYLSTIVIKLMLTDAENVQDFSKAISEEEFMEMHNYQLKNEKDYKKRIKYLIKDLIEGGFLLDPE